MKNNIISVANVQGYLDGNNTAWLNAEDVARGFGFTYLKDGVEYVRWERVNSYLESFGYFATRGENSPRVGKDDYLPENMVYRLGFKANNETAIKFQTILADEILPSIRKHGAYATPQTIDSIIADPANGIKLLQALQEEREAKQLAQSQVAERDRTISKLQPLADFAQTAFTSDTLVSISQAAKILRLPFGRNTLFKKLRESGIFFKGKNEPKQKYCDADYFRVVERSPIETSKGLMIPVTVYCTQKGLAYINLKFGKNQNNIPQLAKIK